MMRWSSNPFGWKRRYALFPLYLADAGEWLWLEWYWARSMGEWTAVSLSEPDSPAHEGGEA